MSSHSKAIMLGRLSCTIYDFDDTGDMLPMHRHDETTVHISIVARGALRCRGDGWDYVAPAGAVLDWQVNDPHEFIALEPKSRLVNIIKA